MQLKPITAIVVLSLIVASLLVSGCINLNISSTPTPSQSRVDLFVNAMHDHYNKAKSPDETINWQQIRVNDSTITVRKETYNSSSRDTSVDTFTVQEFKQISDAKSFVAGISGGYLDATNAFDSAKMYNGVYEKTTGYDPSDVAAYIRFNNPHPHTSGADTFANSIERINEFVVTQTLG